MKILLVSEGIHEEHGALEKLVQRVITKIESCTFAKVSSNAVHSHPGIGKGYFKRALRWMITARDDGYDALVLRFPIALS
jgi:hypothetical protein